MFSKILNTGNVRKLMSAATQNHESFYLWRKFVRLSLYIIYTYKADNWLALIFGIL